MYWGQSFTGVKLAILPPLQVTTRVARELLKRNLLDAPAFLPHQLLKALEHLRAHLRRIIGEIDQVPLAILKDLKSETVASIKGNQRAIDRPDAAFIPLLVAC